MVYRPPTIEYYTDRDGPWTESCCVEQSFHNILNRQYAQIISVSCYMRMTNMYSIRENILLTNKEQGEGLHVTIYVKL